MFNVISPCLENALIETLVTKMTTNVPVLSPGYIPHRCIFTVFSVWMVGG